MQIDLTDNTPVKSELSGLLFGTRAWPDYFVFYEQGEELKSATGDGLYEAEPLCQSCEIKCFN